MHPTGTYQALDAFIASYKAKSINYSISLSLKSCVSSVIINFFYQYQCNINYINQLMPSLKLQQIFQMLDIDKAKSKYELILMAKLAQQTERYDEMAQIANKLLISQEELTSAQRNLCASAYKNLVNNRRAQIKVLDAIENKTKVKQAKQMTAALRSYKKTIQDQLIKICLDLIKIIEQAKHQRKSVEARVFCLKMKADFCRYLCEVEDADGTYFESALNYYEQADKLARSNLPPTNQVRLSLHLNMSVFFYERCSEPERALELANRAFDEAVANVNETNQESFKNCTMILQLIRDNINLWSEQTDA